MVVGVPLQRDGREGALAPGRDSIAGNGYEWTYYLLGGSKEQLSVWKGLQTSDPTFCSMPGGGGSYVHLYPGEYLTYAVEYPGIREDIPRIKVLPNSDKEYRITDHLASIRVTLDQPGTVVSTSDYEPFGEILNGSIDRQGFNSREKDAESDLYNNGVRKLDDGEGRFTSIDPLWEKFPSWSPYQYGYNNPLSVTDPSGMQGEIIPAYNLPVESGTTSEDLIAINIVNSAKDKIGSAVWAKETAKGNFAEGSWKCNQFVYDVLVEAGASPGLPNGNRIGQLLVGSEGSSPPTAGQWADPEFVIPGWKVLDAKQKPLPGDVAAYKADYVDATGHVAIVSSLNDERISATDETVVENDWGFRESQEGQIVFRRYIGKADSD